MAFNRGNPDNSKSTLFKQLTRLLSGPITNYRRQNPRQLKRRQLDKYRFRSASGQPFKKSMNNPMQQLYLNARNNQNRAERYIDFDQMEFSPECGAALEIYADEMTTSSPLSKLLNINCPNEEIKGILENLYFERMNIEYNAFGWSRNLCKYGDYFLYLDIDPKEGIKNFIGLPSMEIERLEGEDPTNPSYIQFQWNSGGITFENWQVAHFRILGNDKYAPYGCSIYDPARRIWRQLNLQEEAMQAYRIVRSPERRVFYIDVGGIPEEEVEQYIQKIMTDMKRNQIVNPDTGQIDLRYNPTSIDEDYYLPVIGNNSATKIESLPGGSYPIRKDSDIPLLDGRILTIEALSKEFDQGKENWVYSISDNDNQIVPGKVIWCGKNYDCEQIHRVWLDDNSYIDMAPEHPVILRDGTSKCASELKENDSLMPFYFEKNLKKEKLSGYSTVYNPNTNKYEFVHRLVANSIGGKKNALEESQEKTAAIHHIDFKKENNRPDNLKWMGFWAHRHYHQVNGVHNGENLKKYLYSDKHKKNTKNRIADPQDKLHQWIYGEENISRLVQYNKLPQTIKNTSLRNKQRWENEEFRKLHSGKNHKLRKKWDKFYSNYSILELQNFCKVNKFYNMKDVINAGNCYLKSKEQCRKFLQFYGINSWNIFKTSYLKKTKNHKVSRVEILKDVDAVYCMTVVGPNNEQDRHNFAVCGKTLIPNKPGTFNGIFVKNTGDIDDVKYLRSKLLAALKIPAAYLISSDDSNEDKTTLAQKDISFARTIQRLQRCMTSELEKIGVVHLFILGYRGKDLLSFKLGLNNPSKLAELQELEHWKTKFEVAGAATEGFFSKRWVAKNILNMSDEAFLRNTRERYFDAKLEASIEKIANEAEVDSEMGGDGLGDLGGDEDLGGDMEIPEEPEDDSSLLAAPGKRPNEEYLTPRSKGKTYTKEINDKRISGARKRSMKGQYNDEIRSSTTRNIFKGASELKSLARGVYEGLETTYKKNQEDENRRELNLLSNNKEIQLMIESLEKKASKVENEQIQTQ